MTNRRWACCLLFAQFRAGHHLKDPILHQDPLNIERGATDNPVHIKDINEATSREGPKKLAIVLAEAHNHLYEDMYLSALTIDSLRNLSNVSALHRERLIGEDELTLSIYNRVVHIKYIDWVLFVARTGSWRIELIQAHDWSA
jgi:hypothetical protein